MRRWQTHVKHAEMQSPIAHDTRANCLCVHPAYTCELSVALSCPKREGQRTMDRKVMNKSTMGDALARPGYILDTASMIPGCGLATIAPPTGTCTTKMRRTHTGAWRASPTPSTARAQHKPKNSCLYFAQMHPRARCGTPHSHCDKFWTPAGRMHC